MRAPAAVAGCGSGDSLHMHMRLQLLGRVDYEPTVLAMRRFTEARTPDTPDEIWLCEHSPVFTHGLASRAEHLRDPHGIAVVHTNRGGQVTYHGPGQVLAYALIDLARLGLHVKEYVFRLEQALLKTLESFGVTGHRIAGAPGIYVRQADPFGHAALTGPPAPGPGRFDGLGKIAALGVKISRHRSYHGVALNVAMDLEPFDHIDPCGYAGLQTVDLARLGVQADWLAVAWRLGEALAAQLGGRTG